MSELQKANPEMDEKTLQQVSEQLIAGAGGVGEIKGVKRDLEKVLEISDDDGPIEGDEGRSLGQRDQGGDAVDGDVRSAILTGTSPTRR
eukprot:6742841-Pyramimonas_sp.AAC.1